MRVQNQKTQFLILHSHFETPLKQKPLRSCGFSERSSDEIYFFIMSSVPVTGPYNDGYVRELYESFRRDPTSVDEGWRQYFRFAQQLAGTASELERLVGRFTLA